MMNQENAGQCNSYNPTGHGNFEQQESNNHVDGGSNLVPTILHRNYIDANKQLNALYDSLKGKCGIASMLLSDRRQRRKEIISHIHELEDTCIKIQKQIVTEALENKRVEAEHKIMWDRLQIITNGLMDLSNKRQAALCNWLECCEKNEDEIKRSKIKNPKRKQRLLETAAKEEDNLYSFIENAVVEFQNKLEQDTLIVT